MTTATPAWAVFAQASRNLARRWHREEVARHDWLCPAAVRSISLPVDPRQQNALDVTLKDGVSARDLPKQFGGMPIRVKRGPVLRAESGPPSMTLRRTLLDGTATALVRDRLNGERCYLLTCGHVVAPDSAARYGDQVRISLPTGDSGDAFLREWQPAVGPRNSPSAMDAALIELDGDTLIALRNLDRSWLPRGLTDSVPAGSPIALQRVDGSLDGVLCDHWSGEVGTGGDSYPDYFLEDAIGYQTDERTRGGDSGAAIWAEGDALFGMHIGSIEGNQVAGANAVLARVKPALDWYCVKPFTRLDPATLTASDWPTLPKSAAVAATPAVPGPDEGDLQILAKTVWGEARGEGVAGMEAVASVVLNRLKVGYRGQTTATGVCLQPSQFSCWDANDPNRILLTGIDKHPDNDFKAALGVASRALSGQIADPTRGSKHYVSTSLPQSMRPTWLREKRPCIVIGRHEFYNDIR